MSSQYHYAQKGEVAEPCDTLVSVSMSATQKRQLRQRARLHDLSMSALVRSILDRALSDDAQVRA
jgi:hypothetical protein